MSDQAGASGEFQKLSETVESAVELVPPTSWSRLRRHIRVCRFRLGHWAGQGPVWERLLYTAVYLSLPLAAATQMGWNWKTISAFLGVLLFRGVKAYRDNSPRHMQQLAQGYLARKLLLYRLVQDVPRAAQMNAHEISRFQREVLHLIATYVRDHRRDVGAKLIFANLLTGVGDEMVVIARDQSHRIGGARYPKAQMIAARALETGKTQLVGDLYAEWPDTVGDKPYRSVLAIPVFLGDRAVGVVSVDSSLPWHFHADPNLANYLMPYVGLLAWTLDLGYVRNSVEQNGAH